MANIPRRMQRVNQLLREEVAKYLQEHYSQHHLGLLTVVGATVANDLKNATIFVSVLGDKERQEAALAALNDAAREVRLGIRKYLSLKVIPNLVFELDRTAEQAERIERLLRARPSDSTLPASDAQAPGKAGDPES